MKRSIDWKNYLVLIIFVSIIIAVNFSIISNSSLLVSGDGLMYYLSKVFLVDAVKEGELPLWNPYTSIGTPFLADIQQSALSPFNILYFIFDTPLAFNVFRIVQLSIAAFFMYLLMKELTGKYLPSIITGFIFSFSTVLGGYRVEHITIITTVALFPAVLYFLEKFRNTDRVKWIVFSAVTMAIQFLSGFTQIVLYFDILVFACLLAILLEKKYSWRKMILLIVKWIGLYLALISIQLIPTVTLIITSGRNNISWELFSVLSYDLRILLIMLCPYAYKNQFVAFNDYASSGLDIEIYIGIICLIYLLYEVIYRFKEHKIKFLTVVLLVSFFFGMAPHIPIIGKIIYHIPILNSFRVCARSLPIFIFIAIILTGLGMTHLAEKNSLKKIIKVNIVLAVLIAINTIFISCIFSQPIYKTDIHLDYYKLLEKGMFISFILCLLNLAGLVVLLKSNKIKLFVTVTAAIGVLMTLDIARFSVKINEKQNDLEYLLDDGLTAETSALLAGDTINSYRSFVAIDKQEDFYSSKILNIGKYGRAINYQKYVYNSWLTFLNKKLVYWDLNETVYYPVLLKQLKNDSSVISMLGIHNIMDAWSHNINEIISDHYLEGEEVLFLRSLEIPASSSFSVYEIETDWVEANSTYQITLETELEPPELFYSDFYNTIYDNTDQDGYFTRIGKNIYQTIISTGEIPQDIAIYFRIIAATNINFKISNIQVRKIETVELQNRYKEIVISDSDIIVYENESARQLIYSPEKVISRKEYGETWKDDELTDVDKISYVVGLDRNIDLKDADTRVTNIVIKRNSISAIVNSKLETFINHSQLDYPGWKAYVDGERVELYTVNNLIQGIIVPEGKHSVEFKFVPIDFRIGIVSFIIGIIAMVGWLFAEKRHCKIM